MVRFNPKGHSQPDRLKTIQPRNLVSILEPCRAFLEDRGLSLPREDESEIDYLKLAGILAVPDEWMDASVIEGLHIVGDLGTNEDFDQLLDAHAGTSLKWPWSPPPRTWPPGSGWRRRKRWS
jgi:hypothetical protein